METVNSQTIDNAKDAQEIVGSVQRQWFSRPSDEKFVSLEALAKFTRDRAMRSVEHTDVVMGTDMVLDPTPEGDIVARMPGDSMSLQLSNWSFGQVCSTLGAPRKYLAELPAPLAVECLKVGMDKRGRDPVKLLAIDPPLGSDEITPGTLQAVTGTTYGRIFDADVVTALQEWLANHSEFQSPFEWGKQKRALFASDRDVFAFFVDGGSLVDGGGERDQLHRGFFAWNSEVGSKVLGLAFFLFRVVCGNFGIWGAENVRVLKIRHSQNAPDRFIREYAPAIQRFVGSSAHELEAQVRRAKDFLLPKDDKEFEELFLQTGSRTKIPALFSKGEIGRAKKFAEAEEGDYRNLWNFHNGMTRSAQLIPFRDARLDLETRAGKLMELVDAA